MELSEFIKKSLVIMTQGDKAVFIFKAATYPHLFLTQFFDAIKNQCTVDVKTVDIVSSDFEFKSQLLTSFLGMSCIYWLSDASSLKTKQKDDLIQFLVDYQGPHKIIVFFDTKMSLTESKNISVVEIKDRYFFDDAKILWPTVDIDQSQKLIYFLHQIYKIKNSFSLDELFLLKNYKDLLGSDSKIFYQSWVSKLVIADTSLFTLSQLFFEKKEKSFFNVWLQIKPLYSDMFWVSYWSDQIYRAYFFIRFTHEENYALAKQMSFGLPFSFLKQTYKMYQFHELQKLHEAMYEMDAFLKNGRNNLFMDSVYMKFFSGVYQR